MFLVDHDHSQVVQRGEDRRAGADDYSHLAASDAAPFVVALAKRKTAVEDGDTAVETAAKTPHELRRQGNFGNQHQGVFAERQQMGDGLEVDLRLAAAGYTVEQAGGKAAG